MSLREEVPTTPAPGAGPARGLDALLGTDPCFSGALRGYDRLQVDTYVAWAENEIALARRESDHLLSRYAACSGELQNARRRLAQFVRERDGGKVRELVERAERRAAETVADAEAEAERIRAEACTEAEARLAKVAALRDAARAERDELLAGARREAEELRRAAAEELAARLADEEQRARQDREAAEAAAAARLAAVAAEVQALEAQRDEARRSLRRLTGQIGDALQVVAGSLPEDLVQLTDARRPVSAS
ncbi:hypothetical protein [Blastococcus sp. SYSU D00820]